MKVLFVCTGNTCRSPMAEGILNHIANEKNLPIEVSSAGISVFDGDSAAANAVKAMGNINIDISKHISQEINKQLIEKMDLILTMSNSHKDFILLNYPEAKDKIFTLMEYSYDEEKNVADPFGGPLSVYEKTRDQLYNAIENMIGKLE